MAEPAFPCSAATQLGKTSLEQPWSVWGCGPRFGERFPDSRFTALPLQENYIEQSGASFEVFTGNSHLMMQDDNSDALAGMIADWITGI